MAKKYAGGGYIGDAGTNRGSWSGDGESLGVSTGTTTGTTATNRPDTGNSAPSGKFTKKTPKAAKPARPAAPKPMPKPARPPMNYENMGPMFKRPGTGTNWPGQANRNPGAPGTANPEGKGDREMRKGGVVKKKFAKKISAEERKEFKNGKYTGGPAEEKAEKMKGKRMAFGGPADRDGTGRYGYNDMGRPQDQGTMTPMMPGRRLGQGPEVPGRRLGQPTAGPSVNGQPAGPSGPIGMPMRPVRSVRQKPVLLRKGGLVKGCGCASRGVKKPRMK